MRPFIFGIVTIVSLLLQTHNAVAQTPRDSGGCPPPFFDNTTNGYRTPPYADMSQLISPNGKYLAIEEEQGDGGACILNLNTLERKQIVVHGGLPREQDIATGQIIWCPYDSDLLALTVVSFVDPDSSGHSTVYVVNLFKYRVSTGISQLITPDSFGPFGPGHMAFLEWLPGSVPGKDTFMIGSALFSGLYVQETQNLIPAPIGNPVLATSPNGRHNIWIADSAGITIDFADSTRIGFLYPLSGAGNASFSRDNKLFALEVLPINPDFDQVWVYKVSDPSKPIDTINFQSLYCKYSLWEIWPEFITDSTLAVSMHTDGDESSPLWEITIDGRIVRQLTFLPEYPSGVASDPINEGCIHLTSFPNPFTQSSTITFTASEGYAKVSVVNLLGQQVAQLFGGELEAGEHSFAWDASGVPAGMYECIVRVGGEVQRIPILHY